MPLLTGLLVGVFFILILVYLWRIQKAYDFFVRIGIPGPPPKLFFGNLWEIIKFKRPSLTIKKWTDKYGHIFGYFEGHTPVLVISDPDVLQDVFTKSFSKFHSRRDSPFADRNGKNVSLFNAIALRWKRQRFVLNPTFSSVKLKQMSPLIHRSVEILMNKMAEQYRQGNDFDIYAYFKRFTMDTIWSCGFGLDTDVQNNVNDPYLRNSQQIFVRTSFRRVIFLLALLLTELRTVWRILFQTLSIIQYSLRRYVPVTKRIIAESPAIWIMKQANEMIEKRRQIGHTQRTDLLQLMLDSMSDEDFIQVRFFFQQRKNIALSL